jgi:small subunit ribosomal protein S1
MARPQALDTPTKAAEKLVEKKKSYPPPNIRHALTPELEAEYLEALEGQSLDDILEGKAATSVAGELAPETRITGRVSKIYREDIFIDIDGRNQGVVSMRQFPDELPDVGSQIELLVSRFNVEDGLYELTRPTAAVDVGDWSDIAEGQIVEATVTGSNKGGLELQVSGIRAFMPMGQISPYRVETPEEYVGQRLACVVTEANPERRNLVLSHRAVIERERQEKREKLLAELAPGQIREGVVRSIRDFGAFVDLGGVDGLVHVSQLSWDRVNHPSEVLKEGQAIKVRVERIDRDTGKIGLSYREAGENPWEGVDARYPSGRRLMGIVSKVMDFGAFVKLEPGVEGLVHISELAHGRVFRTSDVVSEGQEVEVKVLAVDREKQRISLSLKALLPSPQKKDEQRPADEDLAPPPDAPKAPPRRHKTLKGGLSGPSGGEKFGLKW